MKKENNGKNWPTELLVLMGLNLINKGERGYGLLLIHGSVLGMKIGDLIGLKWKDFIDPIHDECYDELFFEGDRIEKNNGVRELNQFIQYITFKTYESDDNLNYEDLIYVKSKNKQPLNTSTLNRELQKLQEDFAGMIFDKTYLKLNLKSLKSNAMEIAWACDMVKFYAYSKKAFISVSKYMGHRTLKDTIELLELEPRDEISLRFDLFCPSYENLMKIENTLVDKKLLTSLVFKHRVYILTDEFEKARDKSKDYHATPEELQWLKDNADK